MDDTVPFKEQPFPVGDDRIGCAFCGCQFASFCRNVNLAFAQAELEASGDTNSNSVDATGTAVEIAKVGHS